MKIKAYIDRKTGQKLYPVGNWYRFQHMFYNAVDRAYNNYYDNMDYRTDSEDEIALMRLKRCEELCCKWDSNPQVNGIVFATYKDYCDMRDIIGGYIARHR